MSGYAPCGCHERSDRSNTLWQNCVCVYACEIEKGIEKMAVSLSHTLNHWVLQKLQSTMKWQCKVKNTDPFMSEVTSLRTFQT